MHRINLLVFYKQNATLNYVYNELYAMHSYSIYFCSVDMPVGENSRNILLFRYSRRFKVFDAINDSIVFSTLWIIPFNANVQACVICDLHKSQNFQMNLNVHQIQYQ